MNSFHLFRHLCAQILALTATIVITKNGRVLLPVKESMQMFAMGENGASQDPDPANYFITGALSVKTSKKIGKHWPC